MNTVLNQNPFFTNEVDQAGIDADRLYMLTLDEQVDAGQPVDWLERMSHVSKDELDKLWQVALESATAGNVQGGLNLLVGLFAEWARYKAIQYLLEAEYSGMVPDLWDSANYQRIRQEFQQTRESQVVYLATQLHNALQAGQAQRTKESRDSLTNEYTELHQGYTELHGIAMQVIKRQDTTVQEAHTTTQRYADFVHKGFEREQQGIAWMREGVQHMYQFAQVHEQTMVDGMKTLTSHLEQRLPSAIEAAQKKRGSRMLWVLLVILLILGGLVVTGILLSQSIVPA